MKLIVRQLSGLGNQMFQYAAGLFYAAQHNAKVHLVIDSPRHAHSHGHPRPFLLPHFSITAQHREVNAIDRLLLLTDHRCIRPVAGHLAQTLLSVRVVRETVAQRFQFQPTLAVNGRVRTAYLLGYWQVHNIADGISAELRREFAFRAAPTGINLDMLRLIRNSENPVSVHIRRGDYTLEAEGNVALSMDYYVRAMAHLKASLGNPTFFIFSDDIRFAREHLRNESYVVFIDHNDSLSAHEDLRLMASCRHHIIANSTFSWWGAWLNPNADKMVLAPRHWRVANCPDKHDLISPTWTLFE